jgi:hypothetical protein
MRTLCLSIAAVSTFLSASCLANRADAITLGAPSIIRAMIVDIDTVYQAHLPSRLGAPPILAAGWMRRTICYQSELPPLPPRPIIRLVQTKLDIQAGLNGRPRPQWRWWRTQIGNPRRRYIRGRPGRLAPHKGGECGLCANAPVRKWLRDDTRGRSM